ncbi:hypothetical protein [Roseomonas haemaphysalidis]|uniref:Uncharacterized protein n=1 Tax=Roseomonas haemaphysalidis TaxID=2768162 RepID=A0ABS3KTR8_9PROT|nr:hypothetical protein [Roseomonas haemaphysalidis]MBO1080862.1 hypothetical protein [Roseomonas haemaphysalidis]
MTAPSHPAPEPLAWMPADMRAAYRAWATQHGLNIMHQEAFAAGWNAARDAEGGGFWK